MTIPTIETHGLKEVRQLLKAINPEENPALFRGILLEAGRSVKEHARAEILGGGGAPIEGHLLNRTGTLRRSIFISGRDLPRSVRVDSTDVAAHVHELGQGSFRSTRNRKGRSGRRTGYPERPFLLPGADAALDAEFGPIVGREVDNQVARSRRLSVR